MRLSKIKLAGFKSFVDPTVISFPSNRVGVVGPNGCGKSNVIDAVRWVMGESSAKNLRGGAMTDVIFNGSATRKAAEQASIELVFEEVDLLQFPEHAEFSVKREIGRDAQSLYSLNHVRCRRKDITDLFLGTGLGPRSYAIIEQGTISRLIEAKPEELRIFIEEAAGISKYKERRKETEQRMKQTRDNIARLDEVRNELDRQLQKLQKQAKDAEKYQQLQQSANLLKAQLQALRWYALDTAVQEQQQRIDTSAEILQKDLLALQALEQHHKHQREARVTAQMTLETAQARFYELDSHYKRLEQSMTHVNERQEQLQWDLDQLVETCEEATQQFETDQQQVATLVTELQAAQLALKTARATEMQAQHAVQEAETHWQTWQTTWDTFNQQAAEPAQQAQVQRTHLQNLEQRLSQNQQRLHRLAEEHRGIDIQSLDNTVRALETEMATLKSALEDAEIVLETHQETVLQLRDSSQQLSARLHEHRTQVTQLNGRLASLETLQEAALGRNNADLSAWLHVQGLRDVPRLAQFLEVANGWERAVEIVLGAKLQALCIEDMANLQAALQQPPQGQLVIFEHATPANPPLVSGGKGGNLLLDKVKAPWPISSLLTGVWTANDWQEAYQLRNQLAADESVITPQGIWLGPDWLHSQQGTDERAGTLVREREIHRVAGQLRNLDETVATLARELEQQRLALREHENQRDQAQRQLNELRQQVAQLQSQHGGKKARLEHLTTQIQRITKEQAELTAQMTQDDQDSANTRRQLHAALATAEQFAEERERLSRQRTVLQETVTQARQLWQTMQTERHQVEVRLESLRTDQARLQQGLGRQQARLQQLHEQRHELQQDLENQTEPLEELQTELAECQQQRTLAEETLRQAKQTVAHLEKALINYEEERLKLESRSSELRTSLEQARMECQANQVRRQTLEEQLPQNPDGTPSGFVALLSQLPEDATEAHWQAQIEAVERRLQRLGAVNLAALQEFTEQSERKQFFDKQAGDLNEALDSLDSAIRTIDREIRGRFKQTLETVNTNLQTMFPRLFGGGQASLELTGEDVLTAGVAIMARPPGKRNASIHLLSGGEKALTAIALVFSIFEINPAPFCMLDEVDAPLDDTNVGRFCALVKAMSERVQFIFISHNKITMEIADQLIGVTMQEAGVSRPVTVDINTAVEMVAV